MSGLIAVIPEKASVAEIKSLLTPEDVKRITLAQEVVNYRETLARIFLQNANARALHKAILANGLA